MSTSTNEYFKNLGINNKTNIPNFNWKNYFDINPDLRRAGLDNEYSAIGHYISRGKEEGRRYTYSDLLPENFDYRLYQLLNPDLRVFSTQSDIEKHYLVHGIKENRRYSYGITYDQMMLMKNNQTNNILKPTILLVNHDSSLTGAPVFLTDLANWLDENNFKNILFVDVLPNTIFKLNKNIETVYHFNDCKILLDIINNTIPILIYSNSLNLMVQNPKFFSQVMHKTVFHLHEYFCDAISFIKKENFNYIVENSKNIAMVAPQIVVDSDLSNIQKVKVATPFLNKEKRKLISKHRIKNKRISDKITICMCGAISERKNPKLFIYLAKHNPDYHFVWIGGDLEEKLPNLQSIKQTPNPYKFFSQIDYFFLTSLREPCGIVILENLLLNNKIILLENNFKYQYDTSKLENVITIYNHNNNFETIDKEFKKLILNKESNKTEKNIQYIQEYFSEYRVTDTVPTQHRSHIILSFYNKKNQDLNYYTNIINQKLLFDNSIDSVTVSIAEDDGIVSEHFLKNINHKNILINKRKNAGWDIGGLIYTLNQNKILYNKSDYIIYIHNKNNLVWRQELYNILYYNDYFKYNSTVSKQWYVECEKDKILRKLFKMHKFMEEVYDKSFNYISGTCFITQYNLLQNLVSNAEYIIDHLTDIDTDDKYWQKQMSNKILFDKKYNDHKDHLVYNTMDADARDVCLSTGSKNYFELLVKHNKKGIPDYTFEHALERYIGYLISNNQRVITV